MASCRAAVLASSLAVLAAGHGLMTLPSPRQGGSLDQAVVFGKGTSSAWYTNNVNPQGDPERIEIPGKATNCDERMLTRRVSPASCGTKDDPLRRKPWRAPGTAPILSPCGVQGGGPPCGVTGAWACGHTGFGRDGVELPPTPRTVWRRGSAVRVAWSIQANHGGGYAYRLCPAGERLTEACFQRHHLPFAGNKSIIHWVNGTEVTVPAVRTTLGTSPLGSEWARNPIPIDDGDARAAPFPRPCPGCDTCPGEAHAGCSRLSEHSFSIMDELALPASLAPGDYVLSWRWDCEVNPQVWNNCADVIITDERPVVHV